MKHSRTAGKTHRETLIFEMRSSFKRRRELAEAVRRAAEVLKPMHTIDQEALAAAASELEPTALEWFQLGFSAFEMGAIRAALWDAPEAKKRAAEVRKALNDFQWALQKARALE